MKSARPLVVLSAVILVFAASCSGGASDAGDPAPAATFAPGFDASAEVGRSAMMLAASESASSTFEWRVQRDGFDIRGNGEYAANGTAGFRLKAHYEGRGSEPVSFKEENDSELLIYADRAYVKSPALSKDWVVFTPAELGPDWDVAQRLLTHRSPFDFGAVASKGTAQPVGATTIDGAGVSHVRITVDADVVMSALADAYGGQGQVMLVGRSSGAVPVDVWLDAATGRPRRIAVDAHVTFGGAAARLTLKTDFASYEPVSLGDAPTGAQPVAELISGSR